MAKKKKSKKKKKKVSGEVKRDLVFKTFQEEYGLITKKLGDRRVLVQLACGGGEIMGLIPGRFRRRCWFDIGDLCLVSHREFQEKKVDILYKYTPEEMRRLTALGEISSKFNSSATHEEEENEDEDFAFDFDTI